MKINHFLAALMMAAAAIPLSAQRMAVLSDIHVTPGNENETRLRQAVAEINAVPYDVVIVDGDLTNEGSDEQLTNVKSILDSIAWPLYVLPGNHENNWSQSATKTFVDLWGNDRFVATVDSLVIIGINCGPFMKMGDGHIKQEDLHWLRATLAENVKPGMRVLNFNHYPLLDDLDNCADYMAILQDYPVIGHINGHYHTFRQYNAGGPDSGSDMPAGMVRALDMRGGDYGYSIVDVSDDWVKVYNKRLGQKAEPVYAWAAKTSHKPMRMPEAREIVAPQGFTVEKVWADSASIFTRLGFDAENVYFGNSLGQARAVRKADGSLRWSVPTGASLFSRPVDLGRGRIAVPAFDGIHILDAATGRERKFQPSQAGPYVADGTLTLDGRAYIQGGYKRIERRRPSDGKLVWTYDSLFNYCQAAPAIDGTDLIFGAWDTNLRNIDLNTGRLKWVWNNGKTANMLGPGNVVPVISGERVYIVAPDRYMTAIDRATGRTLWRNNNHRYRESIGVSADGSRIYAKTMDGELVAVDATAPQFKELWTLDMGLGYEHAPCLIIEHNGLVYAGSRRGILTIVDPATPSIVASLPLGVSEINGIDLDPATGDIYVSLIEGTVYRISDHRAE